MLGIEKLIAVVLVLMLNDAVMADSYWCDSSIRARTLDKIWTECPRHRWPPYAKALYVGDFRDGTFNGQGTLRWENGNVYIGRWRDGKMHGQGTLTFANGDKHVGSWEHGQLQWGTVYD
jgi:hypothetical protein